MTATTSPPTTARDVPQTVGAALLDASAVSTAALAKELGTTPGAIYKALHDARSKLRAHIAQDGLR
jgi:DNA-directed RNA polymerase specialized sigma24 family protein